LDSFTRQSPQYGGGQDGLQGWSWNWRFRLVFVAVPVL